MNSPVSSSLSSSDERLARCFTCFLPLCGVRSSFHFFLRLKASLECFKLFKLPTSLGVSSSSTSSPETPKSSSSELQGGQESNFFNSSYIATHCRTIDIILTCCIYLLCVFYYFICFGVICAFFELS